MIFPDAAGWAEERERVAVFAEHPSHVLWANRGRHPRAVDEEAAEDDEEDEEEEVVEKPRRVLVARDPLVKHNLDELYRCAFETCASDSTDAEIKQRCAEMRAAAAARYAALPDEIVDALGNGASLCPYPKTELLRALRVKARDAFARLPYRATRIALEDALVDVFGSEESKTARKAARDELDDRVRAAAKAADPVAAVEDIGVDVGELAASASRLLGATVMKLPTGITRWTTSTLVAALVGRLGSPEGKAAMSKLSDELDDRVRAAAKSADPVAAVDEIGVGLGELAACVTRLLGAKAMKLPTGTRCWTTSTLVAALVGRLGSPEAEAAMSKTGDELDDRVRAAAKSADPVAAVEALGVGLGDFAASIARIAGADAIKPPTGTRCWTPSTLVAALVERAGSPEAKAAMTKLSDDLDERVRAAATSAQPLEMLHDLCLTTTDARNSLQRMCPPARFANTVALKKLLEELVLACSLGAQATVAEHVRARVDKDMRIWTLADAVENVVAASGDAGVTAVAAHHALCEGGLMGPDTATTGSLSRVKRALYQGASSAAERKGYRKRYVKDGEVYRTIKNEIPPAGLQQPDS